MPGFRLTSSSSSSQSMTNCIYERMIAIVMPETEIVIPRCDTVDNDFAGFVPTSWIHEDYLYCNKWTLVMIEVWPGWYVTPIIAVSHEQCFLLLQKKVVQFVYIKLFTHHCRHNSALPFSTNPITEVIIYLVPIKLKIHLQLLDLSRCF